jgi:hypothetical protein
MPNAEMKLNVHFVLLNKDLIGLNNQQHVLLFLIQL